MKNLIIIICLFTLTLTAKAQNGLEYIIVEKYYVSNAADAAGSIGTLPAGSVTYRIYADMLPGYKFQAAYGVTDHELKIATTTSFFNNEDRGATTPAFTKTQAVNNTVMLDSWLSVGAACSANFGILKSEDNIANGGANAVNANGILQNNDPAAGIPLTTQDGFYAGTPQTVTFVGLTTELNVFDATSQAGNSFSTFNGSWASLSGSQGPVASTNKVLIAQMTTNGCFSFELNIQIGTPTGGVQNYVAKNPVGNEILLPSLTYNKASVSITANPVGAVCAGTNVTFTALPVNGGTTPVYQWKKNGVVVGSNSSTYASNTLSNNDQITCKMTSNATVCGATVITSNAILANISPLPVATVTPIGPTTFCAGTNALTLSANAGTGYTYQWKKGANNIAGATSQTYVPTTTNANYKVIVTNSNGCNKTSSPIAVTVNALPTATITTNGPTTFCSGANPLTLTANTGTGYTYQWRKAANNIAGATSINYIPTATNAKYNVVVTNSTGCSKVSANKSVTVNPLPTSTITAQGPTTFCAGGSVILQANSGTGLTYQWIKGVNTIAGATLQNYSATTGGNYKVAVTNANGCSKQSATTTVTVNCRTEDGSVEEEQNQLSVFPNPTNGLFAVKISNSSINNSTAHIELKNILGQTVYSSIAQFTNGELKYNIDLNTSLAKGVYYIKVQTNTDSYDSKIVLQ